MIVRKNCGVGEFLGGLWRCLCLVWVFDGCLVIIFSINRDGENSSFDILDF